MLEPREDAKRVREQAAEHVAVHVLLLMRRVVEGHDYQAKPEVELEQLGVGELNAKCRDGKLTREPFRMAELSAEEPERVLIH